MSDEPLRPWQPWEDFKSGPEVLPIFGPPCPYCRFWYPVRKFAEYGGGQHFDGVILCHADEQHRDFSCYKPPHDRG